MSTSKASKIRGAWTGRYYRTRHRIENAWWDLRATIAGYCNDNPWRPNPGEGGYSFWRCCRKFGHDGRHRFRNYAWDFGGRPDHIPEDWPVPVDGGYVDQPWSRNPTLTLRQTRAADAWHRQRLIGRKSAGA